MNKKKLTTIFILLFLFLFLVYKQISFSTHYLNSEESNIINEKYSLNLPNVEWKYTQYERNSLFKKESKIQLINYYECEIIEDCDMKVIISITENDEFMKLTLPFVKDSFKVMIDENIVWEDREMNVKIIQLHSGEVFGLNENEYIPYYRITLEKNNILYQFEFDLDDCIEDIYNKSETEVHMEKLEVYFEFIDNILF